MKPLIYLGTALSYLLIVACSNNQIILPKISDRENRDIQEFLEQSIANNPAQFKRKNIGVFGFKDRDGNRFSNVYINIENRIENILSKLKQQGKYRIIARKNLDVLSMEKLNIETLDDESKEQVLEQIDIVVTGFYEPADGYLNIKIIDIAQSEIINSGDILLQTKKVVKNKKKNNIYMQQIIVEDMQYFFISKKGVEYNEAQTQCHSLNQKVPRYTWQIGKAIHIKEAIALEGKVMNKINNYDISFVWLGSENTGFLGNLLNTKTNQKMTAKKSDFYHFICVGE